jgi:epoxide hydrolase-like predicted phosphatase
MKFRAIGFDYGGVIDERRGFMAGMAKILDTPLDKLKKIYYQHNQLVNVDGISYDEFWKIILDKINKKEKLAEVSNYIAAQKEAPINPQMVELVDHLRKSGYKVGLLSNNSRENGAKMRREGLDQHFDAMVVSAEVGLQKPSLEIFELFIKKLAVSPQEMIFVDDSEQSLLLSKKIGFYPVLFQNYDGLIENLASLGILSAPATESLQ